MSFSDFSQYQPVNSRNYRTYPLQISLPVEAEQQTIAFDTIDRFGALWAELFFLNRSGQDVSIVTDPKQPPFILPPQTSVTLEGWSRTINITSGSGGFGTASDLRLSLVRRNEAIG